MPLSLVILPLHHLSFSVSLSRVDPSIQYWRYDGMITGRIHLDLRLDLLDGIAELGLRRANDNLLLVAV